MKKIIILVLFLPCTFLLVIGCSMECGVDNIQVINNLNNYQSVIGYVRDCGATSTYTINVSFITPEMNIKSERGNIFRATHTSDLKIEKINKDTVKIIFAANTNRIDTQLDSLFGIKFVYENKWGK